MNTKAYKIKPGKKFKLSQFETSDKSLINGDKDNAQVELEALRIKLEALQELLYAEGKHKLLIVLQAMDTAGKDSTIRMVFDGVNPQGVKVASFKAPTAEELAHDFLWRIHAKTPAKGEIVIFNRSHYEDVLITRVNDWIDADTCKARYQQINDFEQFLVENGTTILKFYLHISKDEQKERLLERRDTPRKQWKFNPSDLASRAQWGDYMQAYTDAIAATSTKHAPWYIVPANSKLQRNLVISNVICDALENLKMDYPKAVEGLEKIIVK
ncbi:MAG: polyphosphate kinase 2 family protein [Sulfuriferula sp.]